MSRLLITGSRIWTNQEKIDLALYNAGKELGRDTILVSGACPTGADRMCEVTWESWGGEVERWPADWELYGKMAGRIRNEYMVELGADLVLAFIKDNSKGASHCVKAARLAGLRVIEFLE